MNLIRRKQFVQAFALIALGFFGVFFLSRFLERNAPPLPADLEDENLVVRGEKLKGFLLGFEGLIADWYWMKSLQYLGNKVSDSKETIDINNLKPLNPRLLYPYLNNATDLDSRFMEVYSYGAMVLPAVEQQQAIKFTLKGIANNPDEWRLYHYLGYIYWQTSDYEKAAQIYQQGATKKNSPEWMKSMSAKVRAEGGNRDTARQIYQQMLDESDNEKSKEAAQIRLLQLDSLDERDAARGALVNFKNKNNRCAEGWREILPLLKSIKLPGGKDFRVDADYNLIDPSGAAYILDREKCDVLLDWKKSKIPLR